jgi:hypothetical protein
LAETPQGSAETGVLKEIAEALLATAPEELAVEDRANEKPGSAAPVPKTLPTASPTPHGDSWDWPLSRPEKVERVRLIDRQVASMDQKKLEGEIAELRSASQSRRTSDSSQNSELLNTSRPSL